MKDRTSSLPWRLISTISVLFLIWSVGPWLQTASAQGTTPTPAAGSPEISADEESTSASTPTASTPTTTGGAVDPWAGVEEMLVTSSGSGSLLGDIAQANSVTAFDEETLQAIGAADISDLAAFTPNLEIVTAGSTSPTFFIRGIGLNDFNANAAGAVAIYQDDVAINSPALQLGSLFDVESANVLRGPQGTGAYRNASAGSIKVYSRKPSGDFGSAFSAEYGNFNSIDVNGALEFPVFDEILSGRVSFRLAKRDGFMRNRCAGAPPFSERALRLPGQPATDPRWSYCGEAVSQLEVSSVQPEQRDKLNGRDNWAARGVLRFQPDLVGDIETEWLAIFRGSRIDQPSTVGQSVGTGGTRRFSGEPQGSGLYAGRDQIGYQDLDIVNMRNRLVNQSLAACAPTCSLADRRNATAFAEAGVSKQVARDLDSDPFAGAFSTSGTTRNETFGLSLKGETDFGEEVHLRTVFGYDHWKRHVAVDLDMSPNTAFETSTDDRGYQLFGEAAFSGTVFEDIQTDWAGPVDWEVGAFVLSEDLDVRVDVNFGPFSGIGGAPRARIYNQTVLGIGAYTHLSWDFFEVFTLDGGVRFNYESRQIDYELFRSGAPFVEKRQLDASEPTGTVRLTYRPTADVSIYAKYTRGWKSGTFNATGNNFQGIGNADPEKIDSFEVGANQSYFDGMFSLYVSFFHYAYQDYQLFTSQSGFLSPPEFVILNASDVELYGSEIEATFLPWEGGLFDVRVAWLEGEFLEFVQTQLTSIQDGTEVVVVPKSIDNSGNRLLNAPQFTVNLTAQQTLPIGDVGFVTARWDGSWKDDTYYDASEGRGLANTAGEIYMPENSIGQGDYWLHNVRLSYRTADGFFEVAGWVRNVTNQVYKTFSADLSTFQEVTLNFVGDPRTYGVTLTVTY